MLSLGCHLSSSGGYLAMGETALKIGANTFQFFTRNPRGGKMRPWDAEDAKALLNLMTVHEFGPLVAHAPYTLNPAAAKPEVLDFAEMVFREDLKRLENLPGQYYNFHPGSHVKQGVEVGTEKITKLLNETMFSGMHTTVLLETMAGKGTEIGRSFEELAAIIEGCRYRDHIGVCLDTCHVHDAGYDVVHDLEGVLEEFDRVIGLRYLKALHLNDSKNERGAKKDRHEVLGAGHLGWTVFEKIVNHTYLQTLPMVLETPQDLKGYQKEIEALREHKRKP